jgi:type I restriction enzyme M protein
MRMNTKELIDRIFKEPGVKFELTEFENLGKPIHEIITIYPKAAATGKDAGKTKYYLKSFIPFSTGNEEVQVYAEGGKSAPEEIVRQLWVYKLMHQYGYRADEIDLEKGVQFGTEIGTKAADIIVYTDATKLTPKIIVECKKPKRKDGIEQLKSYMNAKGAPVAVWSNGADSIILYRPYPAQFDDTLFDIPKRGQAPKDVLEAKKTLLQLKKNFNFKKIIQDLEELVLADSGKDEFNEIFKLIFAKIWDEKEALENRANKVVEFRKALDPEITYDRINKLFHKACEEWPGIFKEGEDIELAKRHLQVCVGPVEGVRLMGSNLRIMDDAFEYLLPTEAKKKKGQFFTPRHVVEMCVRMLNPKRTEYVMDPACGSGGFLLHAMDWCYPAADNEQRELRKHRYAAKYLWGIDFEQRAAKTSRALMLIAGDGHTNIFGPDVSSLDPKTWYETGSGQALMQWAAQGQTDRQEDSRRRDPQGRRQGLGVFRRAEVRRDPRQSTFRRRDEGPQDARALRAGQARAQARGRRQATEGRARRALHRAHPENAQARRACRHRPCRRASSTTPRWPSSASGFSRRPGLLAVVGLHPNTFKPHTGTKTSVLFVQKYTPEQLAQIAQVHDKVAGACPDYEAHHQGAAGGHDAATTCRTRPSPKRWPTSSPKISASPKPTRRPTATATTKSGEGSEDGDEAAASADRDRIAAAEEKLNDSRPRCSRPSRS